MLFVTHDNQYVEILRKNFVSDKQYYSTILKLYNISLNNTQANS